MLQIKILFDTRVPIYDNEFAIIGQKVKNVGCKLELINLSISGCWIYKPDVFEDERGKFFEWYQDSTFNVETKEFFNLAQANCSISRKGALRGLHFTTKAPGQSKLVTVFSGKVFDVLVDLRTSSPTFGKWESVVLDSKVPSTMYVPWGIGHGFLALEDSVFAYLCDKRYDPKNEYDLNAFDPELNINWPIEVGVIQSKKDKEAPFLNTILETLPN